MGPSESLGDLPHFTEVKKKWKLFQNTMQSNALGLENFMAPHTNFRKPELTVSIRAREGNPRHKVQNRLTEILNDAILEEYPFAAVYLNENYDVIHGFGDYNKYVTLTTNM